MSKTSKKDEVAIRVDSVSKSFKLPHEKQSSIKGAFVNMFNGKRTYEKQQVLKDISFEIKKGEFFGIVGRNGSGKSTLLKLISQIYTPDKGSITVNGKLTPFIELGVGFNPELSGRDNVYLNGALLGFSREEMDSMYDDIVEFAELERFMDQKLKNYSSGMQVRLAFSIAIRADTDILVLDEVLAVGDEAFQRKCYQYFAELKKNKKTVILVTHSMGSVQQFCDRAMLLSSGKVVESGNPSKVAGRYLELNMEIDNVSSGKTKPGNEGLRVNSYGISAKTRIKNTAKSLSFSIEVSASDKINDAVITFLMNRDTGEAVYRWSSDDIIRECFIKEKGSIIKIELELDNIFPDGEYDIQLAVKKKDRSITYALFNRILVFRVTNPNIKKRDPHWKPKERVDYEQN